MACLKGSQNYVWSTTSVLGKGATGAVYQGVNKTNGEPVAVKTFNQFSHLRPKEVKIREFEVLKKVNHENIVKLLAIEEEEGNGSKVIVMELCTGGSLFNILDDPENTYGLEEKEFLLVLEHLTAGMKHLRDNNLVHRDLKPGNIMKFICDDGSTVYKLTDFGAARELQEGEEFKSLYGTEEYLHPDMFERAVLRKPVNKTFSATIDLWSIGVTIYHVATGNLPFRPYGGRRNKETMYYITTKKESGVISGIQTAENGPIEWQRDLPISCQLSAGLKKIVTPLLAGLLELDTNKIWTFDRFFKEVTNALSRKAVNIFHVNKAQMLKVYIHPDEMYNNLQCYIKEQTSVEEGNQLMIFKGKLYSTFFEDSTKASGFPVTADTDPLFLFNDINNNVVIDASVEIPIFHKFSDNVHLENDATQSKLACSIGHLCRRHIERYSWASQLMEHAVENFSRYINSDLCELHVITQHLLEKIKLHKNNAEILQLCKRIGGSVLSGKEFQVGPQEYMKRLEKLDPALSECASKVSQLHQRYTVENTLKLEWDTSIRSVTNPWKTKAPAKAQTLVEHLRDSWQHLVRDRATRTLSFNDEQFHILEGIKITQTINRVKILLELEVYPQYSQLSDALSDWYKIAQTVYLQTAMILKKDVDNIDKALGDFGESFSIEKLEYTELVNKHLDASKQGKSENGDSRIRNQSIRALYKAHKMLKHEINVGLMKNSELLNEIHKITQAQTFTVDSLQ
ncbi:inhibitor of nuclear factor kappa-B kinase subunit epsilon [Coccinella septempunctata]|uniref:inhibitor of nuclear factor kappa-B kinase subunit epsilon n=1 Tax=Coccinella septempunctata TaxID=41139 RepID=UPI001D097CB8|nr:inhibitor of nuclear factor kappa-B kinase subunit epsilon [Coccinella septempunctata]